MILKSLLVWHLIIPLAFANGALREWVLVPLFGEKFANPISGIILCISMFIVSYIFIPKLGKGTKKTYISIGLLWFFSTIIFETVLGFIMGTAFIEIINAYNITTGNLWLIVVIFTGIVPYLVAKLKKIVE